VIAEGDRTNKEAAVKISLFIIIASAVFALAGGAATHAAVVATTPDPTLTVTIINQTPSTSQRGWVTSYGVDDTGKISPAGIDCDVTCSAQFPAGTTVSLWPIAYPGSMFAYWLDDKGQLTTCEFMVCKITLTTSTTMTVAFASGSDPVGFKTTFAVDKSGSGGGTVASKPPGILCGIRCAGDFPTNVNVTLTAAPDDNSEFRGWTGPCAGVGTSKTCVVTIGPAVATSASFGPKVSSQPSVSPPTPNISPIAFEPPHPAPVDLPAEEPGPSGDDLVSVDVSPMPGEGAVPAARKAILDGRVVVHVRRAGPRTIALGMRLFDDARSTVRVLRHGKRVFTTRGLVHAGTNTLRVRPPKRIHGGSYRLVLLLHTEAGVSERLTWPIRLR